MEVFPVLHTPRLDLIEIEPAHAADLFRLFSDKRVTEFYPVVPMQVEEDLLPVISSLKALFEEKQGIRWGITLQGSKAVIGIAGFHTYTEGQKASIVFALQPGHQNKGYITEAIKAVLDFGFNKLGMLRIEAEVMPENIASEWVLTKAGFNYEGLLKDRMLWNDTSHDINMYSITREKALG